MRGENLLLIFVCLLTFCNCSITKRRYLSGYYIHQKTKPAEVKYLKPAKGNAAQLQREIASETTLAVQPNEAPDSIADPHFLGLKSNTQKLAKKLFHKQKHAVTIETHFHACKSDQESSRVEKPLSLFWIVILLVLLLYLAVIIFAAESLLPLGHVIGIIFAALILLWLLRIV